MRAAKLSVWVAALIITFLSSTNAYAKKKILYVDSYHPEYMWSADITSGIKSVLDKRIDVELKTFRMDTKRNMSEDFKKRSAIEAKGIIDSWKPDVVIVSDDNAAKYLVEPYFKDTEIPFVFCGLNWDASIYGFPASNITGMTEIGLYPSTIDALRKFAKGNRVGYLASDTLSEHKELDNIAKLFQAEFNVRFVETFDELKQAFLDLQKEADMVLIQECRSVKGFDHREMIKFVEENTSVPTGAMQKYLIDYALLTFSKSGQEQGEYAARTALEILAGKSPREIPVVSNKKVKIYLNMKIAKRLNAKFPMEWIQRAHLISAERKRLLFVNSYHKGFKWSDDIERGLFKALNIKALPDGTFDTSKSEVELRVFRMDTKFNTSEAFKKQAALSAKTIIEEWQPDIVVTSDDNAAKYLIVPYFRNSAVPFVFCGVSWDASVYGFPASNVTGMVEVAPIPQIMELLKTYAKGNRLGFIGSNNITSHRDIEYQTKLYGLEFSEGKFVSTFDEWKKEYLRLQNEVDMIMWTNPIGITGWDNVLAREYILGNTIIPSAGTSDNIVRFALLGRVRIAQEQGWWSGRTALRILEGADPADIPIVGNKESILYLNMELAKQLKIKFPMELIEEATFLKDQPD